MKIIRDIEEKLDLSALPVLSPHDTAVDAINIFLAGDDDFILVRDVDDSAIGLVFKDCLLKKLNSDASHAVTRIVRDIMNDDIETVSECEEVATALNMMEALPANVLFVTADQAEPRHIVIKKSCEITLFGDQDKSEYKYSLIHRQKSKFDSNLEEEIKRSKRYRRNMSLAMVDIDKLSEINNLFGWVAGDAVLEDLSSTIHHYIREVDFFQRIGGSRFGLIFPETTHIEAKNACKRLLDEVRSHLLLVEGHEIKYTVSIGVSNASYINLDAVQMMSYVNRLISNAKQSGRDRMADMIGRASEAGSGVREPEVLGAVG